MAQVVLFATYEVIFKKLEGGHGEPTGTIGHTEVSHGDVGYVVSHSGMVSHGNEFEGAQLVHPRRRTVVRCHSSVKPPDRSCEQRTAM